MYYFTVPFGDDTWGLWRTRADRDSLLAAAAKSAMSHGHSTGIHDDQDQDVTTNWASGDHSGGRDIFTVRST